MEGTVYFCNDAILRFSSYYAQKGEVSIPLTDLAEVLGKTNDMMLTSVLRRRVVIEAGVTVGSFLLALEPWQELVSALTDRQVDKYIAELRKPSDEQNAFDRCEIRQMVSVTREFIHEPCPEGVDWLDWLQRPDRGEIKWGDNFSCGSEYDICGYNDGDPSNYSMSTNIHRLKNVPLTINRIPVLFIRDPEAVKLFNPEAKGVRVLPGRSDCTMMAMAVEPDMAISLGELLEVVIAHGLWNDTPQGAIALEEMLKERVASLQEFLAEESKDEQEDEDDEEEYKGRRIVVAPGAFDGIGETIRYESELWDELRKASFAQGAAVRIGKIVETPPKEQRARGRIFQDDGQIIENDPWATAEEKE